MKEFKCYDCGLVFQAEGEKKEYQDAIYGPCSKVVATCPSCHEEAVEHVVKAGKDKKNGGMAPCGNYSSCSCCGG